MILALRQLIAGKDQGMLQEKYLQKLERNLEMLASGDQPPDRKARWLENNERMQTLITTMKEKGLPEIRGVPPVFLLLHRHHLATMNSPTLAAGLNLADGHPP